MNRGTRKHAVDRAPVLVIGGAGFIGSNLAHRLLGEGRPVRIFDDLSRPGVERNLEWLRSLHGRDVEVMVACIRDREALRQALRGVDAVFHLAAQVAVTTSLRDPGHDFEVNLRGTLNLLEELRALEEPPPLVFTSTNKVYGQLQDLDLVETDTRYRPGGQSDAARAIDERQPLDFRSPYGCSKGAADQYVLDYARTFGLPAVVFRMSCIYGPHQLGTEEQGWVAHFLLRAIEHASVTIYGDGKQVRDVLFVDDLVAALTTARQQIEELSGQAFNIGGGPQNTVSLLDLIALIQELRGRRMPLHFAPWRPGDQRYYVSDIRAFEQATGWRPRVGVHQGVVALYQWLLAEHSTKSTRTIHSGAMPPAAARN